ncbi:unnamed protein product [Linum trigynum]|uniref:Uncharacterized protein n=1 Tax=Linum trigynum TaxID=586398 RepID=A0AAV2GQZ7_9ROSI
MKLRNSGVEIRSAVTKSNSNTTELEMVLAIQVSIDDLEGVRASLRLLVGDWKGFELQPKIREYLNHDPQKSKPPN